MYLNMLMGRILPCIYLTLQAEIPVEQKQANITDPRSHYFYLTILHQNDIHSHFGLLSSSGYKCLHPKNETCYGGYSRAVHLVKNRIENDKYSKNLLIVNAGDFYKGSQYYSEFKYKLIAAMLQHMPYTALALGDAEFADGLEGLLPFLRAIGEKFICTNIDFSGVSNATLEAELRQLCPRHRIVAYQDGARHVCLLGYTTPQTAYLMSGSWTVFEAEEAALTREILAVRKSRPDVGVFVALGHSGYQRDKEIAHRVPSLDVIVGGHSHTLLWPNIRNKMVAGIPADPSDQKYAKDVYPTVVIQPSGRTVLVVQMYRHGKYLGVLNVTFDERDEVVDYYTSPELLINSMTPDRAAERTLDQYRNQMRSNEQREIGRTRIELKGDHIHCRTGECSLGNTVTDSMLWHLREKAERSPRTLVAIINSGAMWGNIAKGTIRVADVTRVLPYPDTMNVVELPGRSIRRLLEHGLSGGSKGRNFLQMSGMRVRCNMSQPVGQRVQSVRILCRDCAAPQFEPLRDSASYNVTMFSYLALGNDGFTMIKEDMLSSQRRHDLSIEIFVNYVKRFSPLHQLVEGRIEMVGGTAVENTAVGRRRRLIWWPTAGVAVLLTTLMLQ